MWTPLSLLTLRLITQQMATRAAVCVDTALFWEESSASVVSRMGNLGKSALKPVSPSLNKEIDLDDGRRSIWGIKYRVATWRLSLHVVGGISKALVWIRILVFANDRKPAWLSWGRKPNFGKGRGPPDSRHHQSQGLEHFHDTLPPTLSSASLSQSALFSQMCLLGEPEEIFKTSGQSSGPGEQDTVHDL